MSNKRGGLALLVLGLVLAVGVASLVFRQAQRAAESARMESIEVLVAAQDIPERTLVVAPYLTVKRMLPTSLPPAAISRPEEVIGKMTTKPILAGDFILPGKLVESDGRAGLAFTVPKGKVVITLPASDILTTGAVRVGDTVDLLVTIKPPEERGGAQMTPTPRAGAPAEPNASPTPASEVEIGTTQTTMQHLKVLAIGSVAPAPSSEAAPPAGANPPGAVTSGRPNPTASLITFAVDRQDALVLKALKDSERTVLELVLRAAGDDALVKTDAVTLQTIVERYQFRAVPTPAAPAPGAPPAPARGQGR